MPHRNTLHTIASICMCKMHMAWGWGGKLEGGGGGLVPETEGLVLVLQERLVCTSPRGQMLCPILQTDIKLYLCCEPPLAVPQRPAKQVVLLLILFTLGRWKQVDFPLSCISSTSTTQSAFHSLVSNYPGPRFHLRPD